MISKKMFSVILLLCFVFEVYQISVFAGSPNTENLSSNPAGTKTFSIPFQDLKDWSDKIIVSLSNAKILGHSKVHDAQSDCEMHFGVSWEGYIGDPAGIVAEPMNLCEQPCFNKSSYNKTDWITFANNLIGKNVILEGVPRIWPEHLVVGADNASNPPHAIEIHPLTKLSIGSKDYNFSNFIYVPEGFRGGLHSSAVQSIFEKIEVEVIKNKDKVDVEFSAGTIGNFTTLSIEFNKDKIAQLNGGHSIEGKAILENGKDYSVTFITVQGSPIDDQIAKWMTGNKTKFSFDALVLFSLSPKALYEAAMQSNSDKKTVSNPIQLIIYGEAESL
jgi:hypothetical protein